MGGVRWTERLDGWLSLDQTDFNQAMLEGRRDGATLSAELTLTVEDIDGYVKSPLKQAQVTDGTVTSARLGGSLAIRSGVFELFAPSSELFDLLHLRMRYRLNLEGPKGHKRRLHGFKLIEDDPGTDMWSDTTTLFVRIYEGWDDQAAPEQAWAPRFASRVPPKPAQEVPGEQDPGRDGRTAPDAVDRPGERELLAERDATLVASAVMRISLAGFLHQLTTFDGTEGSRLERIADVLRYGRCFGEGLAKTYFGAPIGDGRPSFPRDRPPNPWPGDPHTEDWHLIPERALQDEGANRHALERDIVPFSVSDLPFALNLHHIRRAGAKKPSGEPVLLIPGSGVRAELFYGQPVGETIVDRLLSEDKDVWVESWRASIDLPNNSYTLDQAARFDHPEAVRTVLARTGAKRLRAIVHCQGSISFVLAGLAGFLPPESVSHVVSSAISLFFEVPASTWLKQRTVLQLVRRLGQGADAQWGIRAPTPVARVIAELSRRAELPCGNVPCQVANYMYGSGWDVLLRHANLDDAVHAWTARELGYTPFSLIQQVAESCRYGHIVPAQPREEPIPPSYLASKPQIEGARFTFIGGTHNRMFDPEGQKRSAEYLRNFGLEAGFVPLPEYGHLDTFWGKDAADQVFPIISDGLKPRAKGGLTTEINPLPTERPTRFGALRRGPRAPTFSTPPPPRPPAPSANGTTPSAAPGAPVAAGEPGD